MSTTHKRTKNHDYNKCVVCGLDHNLTIDHIVPRSKGGKDKPKNLMTLCFKCNQEKANLDPWTWLCKLPEFVRNRLETRINVAIFFNEPKELHLNFGYMMTWC